MKSLSHFLRRIWIHFPLLVPLFIGILTRTYALNFGGRYGVLFGDELTAARETSKLVAGPWPVDVRPSGQLFYLISAPFYYALSVLQNHSFWPRLVYDVPVFHRVLVGRGLNALFSLATIAVVFLTARELWGRKAAFWSALLLALSPTTNVEAHFNATATSMLFWFSLTLLALAKAPFRASKHLYLALFTASLAFFTKPNGLIAIAIVGLWAAELLFAQIRHLSNAMRRVLLPLASIIALAVLVIALRGQWLVHLMSTFLWHYSRGTQPIYAWRWLLLHETAIIVLGTLGAVRAGVDKRLLYPLALTTVGYALGSFAFRVFYVRWLLPIVLVGALFGGRATTLLLSAGTERTRKRQIVAALIAIVLLAMGADTLALTTNLTRDVRERAWLWLLENVPPGARIATRGNWLSYGEPALRYRVESLEEVPERPDFFVREGMNYVILWRGNLDYYNWRATAQWVDPRRKYAPLYDSFEHLTTISGTILHIPVRVEFDVLRITENPIYPLDRVVLGAGWHEVEKEQSSGADFRWMSDRGQVFYNWSGEGPSRRVLSFDAYVFRDRGQVSIYTNGRRVGTFSADREGTLHHAEYPISLTPGLNEISLVAERGCGRPIVYNPESKDIRCISIKVANIALAPFEPSEDPPDGNAETRDGADVWLTKNPLHLSNPPDGNGETHGSADLH
ncbi:MAG TPA: hypothetical protein ENK08_00285 [Chloroflexi bacterium]|nr:hypothetical protein [Chloroflexota bacterium]